MADVSALFEARKNKKKKKKANAISLLERERTYDGDMDAEEEFLDYDDEGGELTLPGANEEEFGAWVEDEDEGRNAKARLLLSGKKTKEVLDLQDLQLADRKEEPVPEDSETKREFHRARQQALAAAANVEPEKPKDSEKSVKQVFRPRQVLEAKAKVSGEAALKYMDNEEYFPALGGPAKTSSKPTVTKSAWGKVEVKVEAELGPSIETPMYLDADFIHAEKYEGRKPGYVFASRDLGTGYYWDGGDISHANNMSEEALPTDEPGTSRKETYEGDQRDIKTEISPEQGEDAAVEPIKSAIDEDEDEMLAELAKLKKKKKKKKKEEDVTEG